MILQKTGFTHNFFLKKDGHLDRLTNDVRFLLLLPDIYVCDVIGLAPPPLYFVEFF